MQTWQIANNLGVSKSIIHGYADCKGIKKAKDYKVVREGSKVTPEQADFILKNYSIMRNNDMCRELNIECNTLKSFANRHKLTKACKLLCEGTIKDKNGYALTQEELDDFVKDYPYMINEELAIKYNIKESQCSYLANKYSLIKDKNLTKMIRATSGNVLTKEQKRFIIENYANMRSNDICRILGISYESLRRYASNRKLKKRTMGEFGTYAHYFDDLLEKRGKKSDIYRGLGIEKEPLVDNLYKSKYGKYHVNQDYFKKIDNEWKAYWLGFLYADGCNRIKSKGAKTEYVLKIALARVDRGHLEKFKNSLQSDTIIRDREVKASDKIYLASDINICNKNICEDLDSLGCTPNKTLTLKFPTSDIVPDKLMRHFIRGFFDGDGCAHLNLSKREVSISFTGMEYFLYDLREYLTEHLNIRKVVIQKSKRNKTCQMFWGNIRSCELIYKFLYQDCNIYLDRKFEKLSSLFCLD